MRAKYRAHHRTLVGRFNAAKAVAKRRKLTWLLSREDFRALIGGVCTYCDGALPVTGIGLDRIENSIGYEVGNVLPCCTYCNRMRNDFLTVEETMLLAHYLCELRIPPPLLPMGTTA
jgi:hypothetical protein